MDEDQVGYRFSPTDKELISFYLKNKNIGNNALVENIGEINILDQEPSFLPYMSKIKSRDQEWYFFSRIEYTSTSKKAMKRTTSGTGYWKITGPDQKIWKDKRNQLNQIGIKKILVYHQGKSPKGVRTPWIMHEYHITCLPNEQNYVICKIFFKGEEEDITDTYSGSTNNWSGPSYSNTIVPTSFEFDNSGLQNFNGLSVNNNNNWPMTTNEQECFSSGVGFNGSYVNNNNNWPMTTNEQECFSSGVGFNGSYVNNNNNWPMTTNEQECFSSGVGFDYPYMQPQTPYIGGYDLNGQMNFSGGNYNNAGFPY